MGLLMIGNIGLTSTTAFFMVIFSVLQAESAEVVREWLFGGV